MDFAVIFLLVFLGLLVLCGAGLGVAAYVIQGRLTRAIAELRAELGGIYDKLARIDARLAEPALGSAKPTESVVTQPEWEPTPEASLAPVAAEATPSSPSEGARGRLRWLEELAGGRLSVLLGALALALGGVFLVRYSIEQGWLGPFGRIALGTLFSAALAASGEYLRRSDQRAGRAVVATAYVPGALTAAAIVTALATIYAAYALYGFIGPALAFGLLALCSLAALWISSVHGPALAALGLLGSYATPAIVQGNEPNAWLLFSYLMLVSFACLSTAHLRGWLWLAVVASLAADGWVVAWIEWNANDWQPWAVATYISALTTCTVLVLRRNMPVDDHVDPETPTQLGFNKIDRPLTALLGCHGLVTVLLAANDQLSGPSFFALASFGLVLGWSAWTWRSLVLGPAIGGAATVLSYIGAHGVFGFPFSGGNASATPAFWGIGAVLAGSYSLAGTAVFLSRRSNAIWPCVAAAVPLGIFAFSYWFSLPTASSLAFAAVGAGLAIGNAGTAEFADRRPSTTVGDWGVAVYAAAAVAALALALSMALEKGWLTVALAATAPGLALIERHRPIAVLRWLIATLGGVVVLRLLQEPTVVGGDLGTTPIFNWLLYAYGVPALAFWFAGRELLRRRDDLPVKIAEGASLAFLAGLVGTEVHHVMTGGLVTSRTASLGEYGVHTICWLGLAIGLRLRSGGDHGRLVPRYAALGFGGLGIVSILGNTLLLQNPVLTGVPVGPGFVLNDLLLAYLLPAVLAGILYLSLKNAVPWWLKVAPAVAGLAMAFAYLTLEVGRWFEGSVIAMSVLGPSELYALSVVWLLFGLGLLAAGIRFDNAVLRQVSFGVLLLVTLKVFLVDLAGLTGLLQAGSFIGLGLALIGIGLAYQRLVLRAGKQPPRA